MRIITLPDELNLEKSHHVQVVDYYSSKEILKQQIVLNQNIISFLIEGKKEVIFDNNVVSINASSFVMMRSGNSLMTERFSETSNYRSVLLFFTNEMVLNFIRKMEPQKTETAEYKSVHAFDYDEFLTRFVNSLVDISKLSKETQRKLLEVKFDELMLYLTDKCGTDFLYSLIEKNDNTAQKFIRTIEKNSSLSKLTLKELAFLCNMSVSTFKREFEKHYSESPIKWFQNKRLEHAHYLLNQEMKPSEVYFEIGYENLSSFSQAYKTKYGVTPKQHVKDLNF